MKQAFSLNDLPQKASAILQRHPIRLAYLFGSHATGNADSESDIDIAVLVDASLSHYERFKLRMQLMIELAQAVGIDDARMDIVMLQDVPVLLRYNAVRKGICIFERDRSERNLFVLKVEQEYDDEAYYLKRDSEIILDRILSKHSS